MANTDYRLIIGASLILMVESWFILPHVQEENIWDKWQRSLQARCSGSLSKQRRKHWWNQAWSEYKHLLAFPVQCCVVVATKSVHRLQIRPIVHDWRAPPTIPPSYVRVHAVVWEWGRRQTDTQTATTTINFALSATFAKCKSSDELGPFLAGSAQRGGC